QNIIARTIGLSGVTKEPGDIYPNAALARGTPECILPEPERFARVSTVCFDYAEIRRCVDRCRINRKSLLIQLAGTIGVASPLCGISQRGEQGRIVGRFFEGHTKRAFGLGSSRSHATFH